MTTAPHQHADLEGAPVGDIDIFDLTGRVALITGGAGGIGRAVAQLLGARGAAVALVDVRQAELDEVVRWLTASGVRTWAGIADITDEDAVEQVVEQATAELGTIDVLVNNAAVGSHTLPEELELAEWQRVLDVDLTGSFLVERAVGRRLIADGSPGAVVNMSWIAGSTGLGRGNFVYSIAKGGVHQLTRELAVEWASIGIRVNAIQPCQVNTPLSARWSTPPERKVVSCSPGWCAASPSDVWPSRRTSPTPCFSSFRPRRRWSQASPCRSTGGT